jgi:ribonuclease P protein component
VHDLPRSARLLSGPEFQRVFKSRQRHGNTVFRIHFAESQQARLGMAVSRRVSPRAVVRNRIRRQIRESFRLNRPRLAPMDYVVLAQPAAAELDRVDLRAALEQLWQRFI